MQWDATLGGMLKHGTNVHRRCKVCEAWKPVDVPAMIARYGPAFSLWDFYEACPDCPDGITSYHAQPGKSTPYRPLSLYLVLSMGGGEWHFQPLFPSIPPYSHGVPSDRIGR
jgi:hypothetical protein